MLTQVVGRAGRGDSSGRAVIQTFAPEHKVIGFAARQDYDGFYESEIQMRRLQRVPPFGDIGQITFIGQDEAAVLRGAVKFRDSLSACLRTGEYALLEASVLGPAPCPVPKINYNYRYRITLRCKVTKQIRVLLAHFLRQFARDRENRGVTAYIDVNGLE